MSNGKVIIPKGTKWFTRDGKLHSITDLDITTETKCNCGGLAMDWVFYGILPGRVSAPAHLAKLLTGRVEGAA